MVARCRQSVRANRHGSAIYAAIYHHGERNPIDYLERRHVQYHHGTLASVLLSSDPLSVEWRHVDGVQPVDILGGRKCRDRESTDREQHLSGCGPTGGVTRNAVKDFFVSFNGKPQATVFGSAETPTPSACRLLASNA